uniref:Uncharacterized protein n=1 Tax=Glossina brevipalpis TaxID=37001 RepID=A0A1A9X3C9_9MUSC
MGKKNYRKIFKIYVLACASIAVCVYWFERCKLLLHWPGSPCYWNQLKYSIYLATNNLIAEKSLYTKCKRTILNYRLPTLPKTKWIPHLERIEMQWFSRMPPMGAGFYDHKYAFIIYRFVIKV